MMGVILRTLCTSVLAPANTTTATAFPGNAFITTNTTTLPPTPSTLNASRACHNGSAVMCDCHTLAAITNSTRGMLSEEGSLDALLYIVVVLLFYAFSIVVLMVKYIRRENKEAYLRQYFDEFVAREQFQSAQARNQICMKNIMDRRTDIDFRSHVKLNLNPMAAEKKLEAGHQDPPPLNIPETISEVVEGGDGEKGVDCAAESAEGEVLEELIQTDHVETKSERPDSVLEELLTPRQETPV